MSTRATYQIQIDPDFDGDVTFYIHHDGYPEGAAAYFYAMHTQSLESVHGSFPEKFVRANGQAEFTRSHESHGDTDYRYDLKSDGTLTASKRNDDNRWGIFFSGHYAIFVSDYDSLLVEYDKEYSPIYKLTDETRYYDSQKTVYLTRVQIQVKLDAAKEEWEDWCERSPDELNSSNAQSVKKEVARWDVLMQEVA
jgi:hypothetical protein